jgi:hypothetical protein
VLSPATGFLATVAPEKLASQELDASIGASGPHAFAVRKRVPSSEALLASTASRTNVRDDRETPLEWGGTKSQYSCFYFAVKYNF